MARKYSGFLVVFIACHYVYTSLSLSTKSGYTCRPGTGEILIRSSLHLHTETPTNSNSKTTDNNEIQYSSKQGVFTSPHWPKSYEYGSRCVYRFVANIGEKVHIKFDHFLLSGGMPSCSVDFLDVYIDVASSTLDLDRQTAIFTQVSSPSVTGEQQTTTPFSAAVYSSVLDKSDLLGRYCGDYLSTNSITFISLHREIVIDFYAELERAGNPWYMTGKLSSYGFNGTFEFINDEAFYPGKAISSAELPIPLEDDLTTSITATSKSGGSVGVPASVGSNCRFRIEAEHLGKSVTDGSFHPNGLLCAYQLVGLPHHRIHLDVLDISLYSGSPGCPKDFIQFYDGFQIDNTSISENSIGQRLCDTSEHNMHIVSSGPSLVILFVTGQIQLSHVNSNNEHNMMTNIVNSSRRGVRLRYTFTKKLLPVSEIPGGEHIRGTECDYLINRQDSMEKQLESPTMNNHFVLTPNRVCNFIFIGGQFKHFIETVSIGFERIELPKPREGSNM
ncbi:unnamed protein product [Heterobilharzia americana]|nr:unnamed protein product [Heterobilharzia americana]